jgi:hypothetical protein
MTHETIPTRRGWRRRVALAGLMAAAGAGGCGYSSDSLHPGGIRTVYVEMFQSKEFRRGLEMQLTEALVKQIESGSPYRNAPRNKADSVLSGEVLEVRQAALGDDFLTDQPRELTAAIVVRYRWKDMRTGKMLKEMPRLVQNVEYVPPVGETFFIASEDGMNKLARKIVDSMESEW